MRPVSKVTHAMKWLSTGLLFSAAAVSAKQVEVHDPVMTKEGDTYYVFSTGPGITYYESKDLTNWKLTGRVFKDEPSWAKRISPNLMATYGHPMCMRKMVSFTFITQSLHLAKTLRQLV